MSVVTAVIQDRFHKDTIPQVWDELRRKIADVQPQLPPSVRGKIDGDRRFRRRLRHLPGHHRRRLFVAELRRYAEFLRRELLLVQDVKKVELFAAQPEVVFLEISRQRLAQLGINEEQIYGQLQARNVAADGGRVRVGDQHLALDPKGRFPLGRRHARAGDRIGPVGPPTLPQRCRHARARRPGPTAPFAPLRRQAGHRSGHLHGAGRQRRDDGRRRTAKARANSNPISRSASRSARSTFSPRPSPRPPTNSCSIWPRRSPSSSSCSCSRWAARPG